jgi:hypothetical protein
MTSKDGVYGWYFCRGNSDVLGKVKNYNVRLRKAYCSVPRRGVYDATRKLDFSTVHGVSKMPPYNSKA